MATNGPLQGLRVIEFAGLGPAPFAAMLLSDLGAEVLRIDRSDAPPAKMTDVTARGRSSLALDLKTPDAKPVCMALIERADVLIEGFRPGVMERLGLGADAAMERNPALIYGRMTGWGQTGPLAQSAGHDINFIAITGALAALGEPDRPPPPPLNLLGDFGGGSLYLAMGILAALFERNRSGKGQVVDAAIVDGTVSLMAMAFGLRAEGAGARGNFVLDGSAHFYRCYECSDGKYISIGPIEPRFYQQLLDRLGVTNDRLQSQSSDAWAENRDQLMQLFKTRTRQDWSRLLEGADVCFAPVLDMAEVAQHPHIVARQVLTEKFGVLQPTPAPRFSRTPGAIGSPPPNPGEGGVRMASSWGVPAEILNEGVAAAGRGRD